MTKYPYREKTKNELNIGQNIRSVLTVRTNEYTRNRSTMFSSCSPHLLIMQYPLSASLEMQGTGYLRRKYRHLLFIQMRPLTNAHSFEFSFADLFRKCGLNISKD